MRYRTYDYYLHDGVDKYNFAIMGAEVDSSWWCFNCLDRAGLAVTCATVEPYNGPHPIRCAICDCPVCLPEQVIEEYADRCNMLDEAYLYFLITNQYPLSERIHQFSPDEE